jgi:uncharacterized protein YndB with AHSA1/START domain
MDVTTEINATERTVGSRVLAAGEARTVTITRVYNASPDDVWDACTNPERIPRWFLPVSGDLRLGGRYQLEGNAGGTIEQCDPPRGFNATWEYGDEISWIELRLAPTTDGRTRFQLDHIAHVSDERALEFGPGAVGVGWDLGLLGLALYLTTGQGMDPQAAEAWTVSDEGKAFITASSNGWCEASIAAGTDPGEARAAAGRTTAFYTGEPAPGA